MSRAVRSPSAAGGAVSTSGRVVATTDRGMGRALSRIMTKARAAASAPATEDARDASQLMTAG